MDTKGPGSTTVPFVCLQGRRSCKVVGNPDRQTTRECNLRFLSQLCTRLNVGGHILIDDGDLELVVVEKNADHLLCEVQNEATFEQPQECQCAGCGRINLPSLTEKRPQQYPLRHREKTLTSSLTLSCATDWIFTDIKAILDASQQRHQNHSKIENQEGVDNIDEILEVADGVMIARGDLGIEVPQERIPGIQRLLIRKCILAKKPVIVATQMLHTMISNPRPTRAEVTGHHANAIYYRTDALMLSGETAYGNIRLKP